MKRICLILVALCMAAGTAFAQQAAAGGSMVDFASETENRLRLQLATSSEAYPVTPGDIYRLSFRQGDTMVVSDLLVESNYTFNMKVFGSLNTTGMTFAQLKTVVEKAVSTAYPRSMPSLSIHSLGIFQVFLRGETPQARSIVAWGLSRLSEIVESRRGTESSLRNIRLIPREGAQKTYDLFKAYRLGAVDQDPYVRPGDTIVLSRSERRVQIAGAVHQPGTYELLAGDQLRELVESYGRGLTDNADTVRLRVERQTSQGPRIEYVSLADGFQSGTRLENGDIVTIAAITESLPVISFEGAVLSQAAGSASEAMPAVPGEEPAAAGLPAYNRIFYTIKQGERLSDALRAVRGSLAPLADLASAAVVRRGNAEPIPVDLRELLTNTASPIDITLQSNDRIVIPLLRFSVFVSGAVERPGTYPYAPGRTYHYYVILAGGSTQDAPGKIFITDVDGKMRDQQEPIQSEDRIFVIPATIMVQGAVLAPGSFPFRDGLPPAYYVNLAGGVDPERNWNGRVLVYDSSGKPRKAGQPLVPGDRLYAPSNNFVYNVNRYSTVIAALLSIAVNSLILYNTVQGLAQ